MPSTIETPYSEGGYAYGEPDREGAYTAVFSNTGGSRTAKRTLICSWATHVAFSNWLLTANSATVGPHSFVVGAQHPNYSNYFCNSVGVTPRLLATGRSAWQYAELDVTYAVQQFSPGSPTSLREETIEPCSIVVPIPRTTINIDDTTKAAFDEPLTLTYLRYKVTLKQVQVIPLAAIIDCSNKLNTTSMTIQLGQGVTTTVGKGFVRYDGISSAKRSITTLGTTSWDYTHTFLISPVNQNFVYNHKSTAANILDRYVQPVDASGADVLKYKYANMTTLGV